tara:strand:+ start:177 stop:950 length:774 start_codon:yes stop_codon:yes gene_type:complete
MNVAYFIYVGKFIENDMFDVCIRSLQKQSDCKIVVYTCGLENQELLKSRGVEVIEFPKEDWENRRMVCKIEKAFQVIKDLKLNDGDNVLSFDADLVFVKNPFDVFDNDFDFMYTTRHYPSEFKTNGGVWGYKVIPSSYRFMKFFISEINEPKWEPYVNFRRNHPHNSDMNNKDWWVDQDFVCVCNETQPPLDVKLFDAKSRYNHIIRDGYQEVEREIESGDNYVLHLKSGTYNRWGSGKQIYEQSAYESYFKDWLND